MSKMVEEARHIWILSERPEFISGISSELRRYGIEACLFDTETYKTSSPQGILIVDAVLAGSRADEVPVSLVTDSDLRIFYLKEPLTGSTELITDMASSVSGPGEKPDKYESALFTLNAMVRSLNRTLDYRSVLPMALEELMERYGCRHLAMLALEGDDSRLSVVHHRGIGRKPLEVMSSWEGERVYNKVFREVLTVVDVIERELLHRLSPQASWWSKLMDIAGGNGKSDFILFTLKSNHKPVGMVIMGYERPRSWSAEDKECLSIIGLQLGLTLENLNLFDRVQVARHEWETTVDSMEDMVFFADSEGLVQRANEALASYIGLEFGSVIGKPYYEVLGSRLPLEDQPCRRVLKSGVSEILEVEDLEGRIFRVNLCPYLDGEGRASGVVHVVRDITEEKTLIRLEEEKRQLQELDRLKSRFMASVTHELKTPLNAIIGFSELMLAGTYGEVSDRQLKYLENIHTSGGHLLSLITDILDYIRLEAEESGLDKEDIDIDALIFSTLDLMRQDAETRGVELEYKAAERPAMVNADLRRIRQVLFNLVSNALKFTDRGGRVSLRTSSGRGEVVVEVEDTGVGVAPEDQEKIFREFTQVGEEARAKGGTGLGLALSKRLVELHGGRIWIRSEPGEGSVFSFSLPLNRQVNEEKARGERGADSRITTT
ncbi:MAG: ATP-binding protein [Actinomycetota bacterium]|nr:ATP-binding protein [Actinomycetota bacterium]